MVVVAAFAPSSQGEAALRTAIREARRASRELVIASHAYPIDGGELENASSDSALQALARVAARMPEHEREYLETLDVRVHESRSRDIGDFILNVADLEAADLVELALRHAAPIGKLTLGQSARRVLLGTRCPVFIAKDEAAQR